MGWKKGIFSPGPYVEARRLKGRVHIVLGRKGLGFWWVKNSREKKQNQNPLCWHCPALGSCNARPRHTHIGLCIVCRMCSVCLDRVPTGVEVVCWRKRVDFGFAEFCKFKAKFKLKLSLRMSISTANKNTFNIGI